MISSSPIDKYIRQFPDEVQAILEKIRRTIRQTAPAATETISYGIPTFDLDGQHLVHFAAFKKHIGFFPTASPIPVFQKELSGFKTSKGTIQFPLDQAVPYDLIKQIVEYRVRQVSESEK